MINNRSFKLKKWMTALLFSSCVMSACNRNNDKYVIVDVNMQECPNCGVIHSGDVHFKKLGDTIKYEMSFWHYTNMYGGCIASDVGLILPDDTVEFYRGHPFENDAGCIVYKNGSEYLFKNNKKNTFSKINGKKAKRVIKSRAEMKRAKGKQWFYYEYAGLEEGKTCSVDTRRANVDYGLLNRGNVIQIDITHTSSESQPVQSTPQQPQQPAQPKQSASQPQSKPQQKQPASQSQSQVQHNITIGTDQSQSRRQSRINTNASTYSYSGQIVSARQRYGNMTDISSNRVARGAMVNRCGISAQRAYVVVEKAGDQLLLAPLADGGDMRVVRFDYNNDNIENQSFEMYSTTTVPLGIIPKAHTTTVVSTPGANRISARSAYGRISVGDLIEFDGGVSGSTIVVTRYNLDALRFLNGSRDWFVQSYSLALPFGYDVADRQRC